MAFSLSSFENLLLGPIGFLGCDSVRADLFDDGEDGVADFLDRTVARDVGLDVEQAGIVRRTGRGEGTGGLLGLDQRLVKPARRLRAQDIGEHLQGRDIFVRRRRDVIGYTHRADVADAPQLSWVLRRRRKAESRRAKGRPWETWWWS